MAKTEKKYQSSKLGRVGRVEREQRYNRIVRLGTYGVIGAVVLILLYGLLLEQVIRPTQPVAIVNSEEILTKDFQARVRFQRQQMVSSYIIGYQQWQYALQAGDQYTQAIMQSQLQQLQFQLDPFTTGRSVLDRMIEETLIRQQAAEMGIAVTDEEIEAAMLDFFGYYPNGVPTMTVTPTTAPTSTLSPQQLTFVTITPTATEEPTATPDPATADIPTATITPTAFVFPTATMIPTQEFGTQFEQYLTDLDAAINFDEIALRNFVANQLYREKLQEAITSELPRFEEQVWARHILVSDVETAQEILTQLNNGADWNDLALQYSLDESNAANGGDLGWFNVATMVPEFTTVAFNTQVGTTTEPFQTAFGWHIIQVLGHEDRPLNDRQYQAFKAERFDIWLGELKNSASIEEKDYWQDRVPDEPSIPSGATQLTP